LTYVVRRWRHLRTVVVVLLLLSCDPPLASESRTRKAAAEHGAALGEPGRAAARTTAVSSGGSRFFYHGDGAIDLRNFHTGEERKVRFRGADGSYSAQAIAELRTLFRSRGDDRTADVSLRLIEVLDYVQDRFKPGEMLLMSGYRSPEYNAAIRDRGAQAAKSSLHTEGLAADVRFIGLDQRKLWLDIRELGCCGAGYYKTGQFLHLDVGRPRFWEETTSRVTENLSAGNARIFARTDFDRYTSLPGAIVSLHSLTLRPLAIARRAELVPEGGPGDSGRAEALELEPADKGSTAVENDCFVLAAPPSAPPDRFVIVNGSGVAQGPARERASRRGVVRGHVALHTCEPRLEATPEHVESNSIEIGD
jgi:uncharacterized protein YcbK (DUF882 family)